MSFFGFDPSAPREKPKGIFDRKDPFKEVANARKLQALRGEQEEELDFEDTYDGLGDRLDEANDDFNDDTFGGGIEGGEQDSGNVGKDFDFFGHTAQVSNAIGEEHLRYSLQPQMLSTPLAAVPATSKPRRTGYERYQDPGYIPEITARSSIWGKSVPVQETQEILEAQEAQQTQEPLISTARKPVEKKKIMSVEEVEAAMRAQSQSMQPPPPMFQQRYSQQPSPQPPTQVPPFPDTRHQAMSPNRQSVQPFSADQRSPQRHHRLPSQPNSSQAPLQAPMQILQNPNRPLHSPRPSVDAPVEPPRPSTAGVASGNMPVITHPQQLMELSEEQRKAYLEEDAKRAKRNHKIFLLSKGNGLMTPNDKNFITRIQLQQLVTATGNTNDPNPEAALTEDFYYQVYSQIRGAPRQHPTQPLGHFAQTYLFQTGGRVSGRRHGVNGDNHMQRMQQQVQRAVEAAKVKPKNKQLIIEGSLGKISFSNAKTPKPLLNIRRPENADSSPSSARKGLNAVSPSDRKFTLRNIEGVYTTLMAMEDHERRMPPPPRDDDAATAEVHREWSREMQELSGVLWRDLKVLDPIVPGSAITHPFIAFLSFAKGKKAIPRVFRHISQEQRVTVLTMIVVHLDQLDVIRSARMSPGETQPPPAVREDIELFSQTVMPGLLSYVSEAPINIMIGLLGLLIDHCNVASVSKTRIGLGIMTMLISRAELVKETGHVSDTDSQQWGSLYNRLFDTLEPILEGVFPGSVNTGDDMYVWQFLAAVGIGASPGQQQRLVIAVKDRVMETVLQSRTLPAEMSSQRLSNVNLFMRAIGLDVEMLG